MSIATLHETAVASALGVDGSTHLGKLIAIPTPVNTTPIEKEHTMSAATMSTSPAMASDPEKDEEDDHWDGRGSDIV